MNNFSAEFEQIKSLKRVTRTSTVNKMYELACLSQNKKYVIYEGEDEYKVRGNIICHVLSVGEPCSKIYMGSAVARNFRYKRTVDLG